MKRINRFFRQVFWVGLFVCLSTVLYSQTFTGTSKRQIYAVVVGISDYKDSLIKDLKFAHRDAEIFAQFLMSPGGGAVPATNIKLLLQENATVSSIYGALFWLQKVAQKNDLVFFYFAGHGDVESSLYKLGFLLAYDSPYQNYLSNAIRIEDLNIMANTLSVIKEANTILITDACHSGKLAGSDNRGKNLIGEQLSKVEKKEVRLASCEPDELSEEDIIWGGGRGVFSYYLINGLKGEADTDKDGAVSLQEIENYLGVKVPKDVMDLKLKDQNPVISGKANTVLAMVDEQSTTPVLTTAAKPASNESTSRNIASNNESDLNILSWYFDFVKDIQLENNFGFEEVLAAKASELPELVLTKMLERKPLSPQEPFTADSLQIVLRDPGVQTRFKWNFVSMIHDQVQEALNLYLKSDEAELVRRRYSNEASSIFSQYPLMLQTALALVDKDHYLYELLNIKYHYFKGISFRFEMPYSNNPDSLLNLAIKEQKAALSLEEKASYIQNELGVLYSMKKNDALARKHFDKAIELSPSWAIPLANLSGLLAKQKKYQQGINTALNAIKLSPGYEGSYTALAANYNAMGNWLLAEEHLRKSIEMNPRNFYTLEEMGTLSIHNLNYSIADSFFLQAELQKQSDDFSKEFTRMNIRDGLLNSAMKSMHQPCNITSDGSKNETDIMICFVLGKMQFNGKNFDQAKVMFKKLAAIDPQNPMVYRYLGEIYFIEQNWLEAEICLKLARDYYLNKESFTSHIATVQASQNFLDECLIEFYEESYFPETEIEFLLGKLYENWGYETKAKKIYAQIIKVSPENLNGYYSLWKLEEQSANFDRCEEIIRNYAAVNKELGERELYAFYKRRLSEDPKNLAYFMKTANFLYNYYVKYATDRSFSDRIVLNDSNRSGLNFPVDVDEENDFEYFPVMIPGIREKINLAPKISEPRRLGVEMYKKVIELTSDSNVLAGAYTRIGDLYAWAGSPKAALINYQKVLTYKNPNSELKLNFINCFHQLYRFSDAYSYLKELKDNKAISFENLLILAQYQILQSKFAEANQLLKELSLYHIVPHANIKKLEAEAALHSDNFNKALDYYLKLGDNPENTYTIARIYALKGDKINARKWRDKSKAEGFNYQYVLDNDPVFKKVSK